MATRRITAEFVYTLDSVESIKNGFVEYDETDGTVVAVGKCEEDEEVLKGATPGRESDTERILSYNIGLGLHDVLYASRIYDML